MNNKQISLFLFDPTSKDEALWEEVIDFRLEWFAEEEPGDPLPPRDVTRQGLELMPQNPMFHQHLLFARDESGKIIGVAVYGVPREGGPNYESGKHMAITFCYVTPSARRQGVAKTLLKEVVQRLLEKESVTLVQGDSITEEGDAFAGRFGGQQALRSMENRLYHTDIDWGMVNRWNEEGPQKAQGAQIVTTVGLPGEEDIDAFARVFTETFNQQPMEDLEGLESNFTPEKLREQEALFEKREQEHIVKYSREPDGAISGLTDIVYNPKLPHRVNQLLTGVQESYRGRGLGKWLKANMLLEIKERYPDFQFIMTGNANTNAPMLSINNRLGFKLHKQATLYKVSLEELKEKLR